ncbi:hypothetical protein PsorP6_016244 [Peronosclerospora sorghi]|uniref:Uncharacterized protein n=1 Tax=Peronosclerospora sorghi TaxID=230839 RepID=A0ACC0VQL2_9STRA|nr:hypothetical protein PsorP6_016244 [Peronosclerospora sorghi]
MRADRLTTALAHSRGRRCYKRAQSSLVHAALAPGMASPTDLLGAVHDHLRVLFDADDCVVSSEAGRPPFDGAHDPTRDEPRAGARHAREAARSAMHRPTFCATPHACATAGVQAPDGCEYVQSYLCLPLVDATGHAHALVELFNARSRGTDVTKWIMDQNDADEETVGRPAYVSTRRNPLQAFCGFLGTLLGALAPPRERSRITSSRRAPERPEVPTGLRATDPHSTSTGTLVHLLDFLQRALRVNAWTVYTLDHRAQRLWARFASAGKRTHPSTVSVGHGIIGRAASTGKPLCDDTMLCVPVVDETHPVVVQSVVVFHETPRTESAPSRAFHEYELDLCHLVGAHVGRSLHHVALEEAATRAQTQAQAVLELSNVLFRALERSPKPVAIVLTAARVVVENGWIPATECNVYMRDAGTRELDAVGTATQGECPLSSVSQDAMEAARSGNIVNVQETPLDAFACEPQHDQPVLVVPVKDPTTEDVLAVLEFMHDPQPTLSVDDNIQWAKLFFDQQDEELARGIARPLASAIRHAQRLEVARIAQRKSAALLSLRPSAAIGSMPEDPAGSIFSFVEAAACRALGASHGALFFVDAPSRSLFARVGADWRGYALGIGHKLQGRVAATGAAVRLDRDARHHPEFDSDYDRITGLETSSLLCVPIKAQPSMSAFSSVPCGRRGRRCSSFSTNSSTDDESDDRPVIGVFYAVNKVNHHGDTEGFDPEDEHLLRAICVELSALVESRAWELVFESSSYEDSDGSDQETESHLTRTFLSQYTSAPPVRRRRRPRSRLSSAMNDHDPAAAVVAPTSYHEGCFLGSSSSSGVLCAVVESTGQASASPLFQWDLDPWQYSPAQLIDLAVELFEVHDLMRGLALAETTLRRFLQSVQAQYLDVPYHNTYHAFATLHMTFLMLSAQCPTLAPWLSTGRAPSTGDSVGPVTKSQAMERSRQKRCGDLLLAPRERLALFVAAFCHDMGHDARTNDFHVRCNSRLARRYNDQSVLENMHAAACFETMRRPGHDVLAGVDDGSGDAVACRRLVRKRIIRSILATDMHRHASIVAKVHEAQVHGSRYGDETLRELLVDAVMHAADVSGPTQTCDQHFRWATRLLEEFNEQHAEEVALGISATAFMDGGPESAEFARVNLAFVDSCAFPLWRALGGLLAGLDGCLANVERNRAMWATRLDDAERRGTKASDARMPNQGNMPRGRLRSPWTAPEGESGDEERNMGSTVRPTSESMERPIEEGTKTLLQRDRR